MISIEKLLKLMVEKEASDLHIICGAHPVMRINGALDIQEGLGRVIPEQAKDMILGLTSEVQRKRFQQEKELDFSFGISGVGRFRINLHWQRGTMACSIRRLAHQVFNLDELNLPAVIESLALMEHGMVLVTGPAGCGKSTTLAAMIEIINTKKSLHVITVEDPIEYLYSHKKSVIEQREVLSDTKSYALALKHVVRQDPDVVMVGEMRDLETISAAITAAETGHLVLSTLHTVDSVQTIERIIDVFPASQQQQVRVQISLSLVGVISQQLINRSDTPGRIPAVEIMVVTSAIRNLIREGKVHQIYSQVETGAKLGMQSFDQSLYQLASKGLIKSEQATLKAKDPEGLKRRLSKISEKPEEKG